jgi:MFS family permease
MRNNAHIRAIVHLLLHEDSVRDVVVLFCIGSVLSATAPTSTAFIIGRALSGLGAAGILAGMNM